MESTWFPCDSDWLKQGWGLYLLKKQVGQYATFTPKLKFWNKLENSGKKPNFLQEEHSKERTFVTDCLSFSRSWGIQNLAHSHGLRGSNSRWITLAMGQLPCPCLQREPRGARIECSCQSSRCSSMSSIWLGLGMLFSPHIHKLLIPVKCDFSF